MADLFEASPFGEPYPLQIDDIMNEQESGVTWSKDMDYSLSLFVRKYGFDFDKAAKAMGAFCQHVLNDLDGKAVPIYLLSPDCCRRRWALLDCQEYGRRQQISRELLAAKQLLAAGAGIPTIAQAVADSQPTRSEERAAASPGFRVPSTEATVSAPQEDTSEVSDSLAARSSISLKPHSSLVPTNKSGLKVRNPLSVDTSTSSSPTKGTPGRASVAESSEEPSSAGSSRPQSSRSELIQEEEGSMSQAATRPSTQSQARAELLDQQEETGTDESKDVPSMTEFEQQVMSEQLEKSNFTIFTHSLKEQCDGFYNDVKMNLPTISLDDDSSNVNSDSDEDVEPVFSNLRVDPKTGEYVGDIRLGPLQDADTKESPVVEKSSEIAKPLRPDEIMAPDTIESELDLKPGSGKSSQQSSPSTASPPKTSPPKISPSKSSTSPQSNVTKSKSVSTEAAPPRFYEDVVQESEDPKTTVGSLEEQAPAPTKDFNEAEEKRLGLACAARGDHAGAVEHFRRAMDAGKKRGRLDKELWHLRGKSYIELRGYSEACNDLEKAVNAEPTNTEARLLFAIGLRFSSRYLEAMPEIEYVLASNPDNRKAQLEKRRLEQRIAHANGQDLDTWKRKSETISVAQEIQARAQRTIEEIQSNIKNHDSLEKEKELEQSFFDQIKACKDEQQRKLEEAAQALPILDVSLGGVDVDDLLESLKEEMPNTFREGLPEPAKANIPPPPDVRQWPDQPQLDDAQKAAVAMKHMQRLMGNDVVLPPNSIGQSASAVKAPSLSDLANVGKGSDTPGEQKVPASKGSIGAKLRALRQETPVPATAGPAEAKHAASPKPVVAAPESSVTSSIDTAPGGPAMNTEQVAKGDDRKPAMVAETSQQRERSDMALEQKLLKQKGRFTIQDDEDSEGSDEDDDWSQMRGTIKNQGKGAVDEADAKRKAEAEEWRKQREQEDRRVWEEKKKERERQEAEKARKEAEEANKRRAERERKAREQEKHRIRQMELEEEEERLLKEKAEKAAAARQRIQPEAGQPVIPAPAAAQKEDFEIEEVPVSPEKKPSAAEQKAIEEDEEMLLQSKRIEADRERQARAASAAAKRNEAMHPIAGLPLKLHDGINSTLLRMPEEANELCVLLVPDLDASIFAYMLQWMLSAKSLDSALQHASNSDRSKYGVDSLDEAKSSFDFQVLGLVRTKLPAQLCPINLRPKGANDPSADPLFLIALGPNLKDTSSARGSGIGSEVQALLSATTVGDLVGVMDKIPSSKLGEIKSDTSLMSLCSVIDARTVINDKVSTALHWFCCCPEVVDEGDFTSASGPIPAAASVETVVSVIRPEAFEKAAIAAIVLRAAAEGLDVCGLRLAYPTQQHLSKLRTFGTVVSLPGMPVLILALRGQNAVGRWAEAVGPEDPLVARRTDASSLRACFGQDRTKNLLTCTRSVERNKREACWWFSQGPEISLEEDSPAALLAPVKLLAPYPIQTTIVVLRAGFPSSVIGEVLRMYLNQGLQLTALRRTTLDSRAAENVGLPPWICGKDVLPGPVCMQWQGENAINRALSLGSRLAFLMKRSGLNYPPEGADTPSPATLRKSMKQFMPQYNMACVSTSEEAAQRCAMHLALSEGVEPVDTVTFSQKIADAPKIFHESRELPQTLCFVATPDAVADPQAMDEILGRLLGPDSRARNDEDEDPGLPRKRGLAAELIGLKFMPWLPTHACRELCCYAQGHYNHDEFMETMEAGPVFVLALRLVDGFEKVRKVLGPLPGDSIATGENRVEIENSLRHRFGSDGVRCVGIASKDSKQALRHLSVLFEDEELRWPSAEAQTMQLLPPPSSGEVIETLKQDAAGPQDIGTLSVVKPEARQQLHKILKYMRRQELTVVGMKMWLPNRAEVEAIVNESGVESASVITGRASVALLLKRPNAVAALLNLCGDEDPRKARKENEFSLRAIFGTGIQTNALHASTSYVAAQKEISLLFPEVKDLVLGTGDPVCGAEKRSVATKDGQKSMKELVFMVICAPVLDEEDHVAILEELHIEDFKLCNIRMARLSSKQVNEIVLALGTSAKSMETTLKDGPCILAAIERDNAIARLQMAVGRSGSGSIGGHGRGLASLLARYKGQIVWSENAGSANAAISYSFDALYDSHFVVKPK